MSYDSWLFRQADDYFNPIVDEVTIKGLTKVDVELINGDVLKNVPMNYYKTMHMADDDDYVRLDDVVENLDDYVDLTELDCFEAVEDDINWNEVVKLSFAEGHGLDDLEVEE